MAKEKRTLEEKLEDVIVKDGPYEVPGNWVWSKLGELLKPMTTKKPDCKAENFKYIDIDAIDNRNQKIHAPKVVKVTEAPSRASREILEGDTLFSTVRPYLRNIAMINEEHKDCIASTGFYVCRSNGVLNRKYLYHLLCSERTINYYTSLMKGDNSPAIRKEEFESLIVPIPPLREQQRIIDRIESLFEKLDKAKELIEEAREGFEKRKAAVLEKAFRGVLTEKWRLENNIVFEDSWKSISLGDTDISIIDGDRGVNYPKKEEFAGNGYCLFLNAKNVTKDGFKFDEVNFITKEKDEILRKGKLQRNDIILTTRGTVGNIAYYDENVPFDNIRINSGMVIYRGGNYYKPYLCWLFKSDYIKNQIAKLMTGTAQPQLPIKIMKNIELVMPSIGEQKEIVYLLDKILREESKINELIRLDDEIELSKKSILAQAFRGELGTNSEEDVCISLKEVLI